MKSDQWESATEGIKSPIKLRNGKYNGYSGAYWAWPVDGYYDLHWTDADHPDGCDVIYECLPSLAEARKQARQENQYQTRGF